MTCFKGNDVGGKYKGRDTRRLGVEGYNLQWMDGPSLGGIRR